jgi:hypothetical protein
LGIIYKLLEGSRGDVKKVVRKKDKKVHKKVQKKFKKKFKKRSNKRSTKKVQMTLLRNITNCQRERREGGVGSGGREGG